MNLCLATRLRALSRFLVLSVSALSFLLLCTQHARGQAAQSANTRENLHGVLSRLRLNPPLRSGDVTLRYSPDGRYLMVQTPVGIYVLSQEPLKMLGHINAPNSYKARFSADSQNINIVSLGLTYERWGVLNGQKSESKELSIKDGCVNAQLSPQGDLFACYRPDFSLGVFRLPEDQLIFSDQVLTPDNFTIVPVPLDSDNAFAGPFGFTLSHDLRPLVSHGIYALPMAFSSDGRMLLATDQRYAGRIDLVARKKSSLPGAIHKNLDGPFAILGNDRILVRPADPAIFSLATGDLSAKPGFKADAVSIASNPRYALLYDAGVRGARVFDLQENHAVAVSANVAADIFGQELALLTEDGNLELYHLGDPKPVVAGQLPLVALPMLRCASLSPESDRLAISVDGEGALYQLSTGKRLLTYPRFSAANFVNGSEFFLMPAYRPKQQSVMRLDSETLKFSPAWSSGKERLRSGGPVLFEYSFEGPAGHGILVVQNGGIPYRLRALDPATGKELWARSFTHDTPIPFADPQGDRMVLGWKAKSEGAWNAAKRVAAIKESFKKAKVTDHDTFLEVLDARSGNSLGGVLVQTGAGPTDFESAFSVGNSIIFSRDEVRVYLYSLEDGQLKARLVGARPSASAASHLLALYAGSGRLDIHDLTTGAKLDEQLFPDAIAYTHFSADGSTLFVLTEHQHLFTLDMKGVREAHLSKSDDRKP